MFEIVSIWLSMALIFSRDHFLYSSTSMCLRPVEGNIAATLLLLSAPELIVCSAGTLHSETGWQSLEIGFSSESSELDLWKESELSRPCTLFPQSEELLPSLLMGSWNYEVPWGVIQSSWRTRVIFFVCGVELGRALLKLLELKISG